jgi:NitT/TauT family transport system substrate-binding protein
MKWSIPLLVALSVCVTACSQQPATSTGGTVATKAPAAGAATTAPRAAAAPTIAAVAPTAAAAAATAVPAAAATTAPLAAPTAAKAAVLDTVRLQLDGAPEARFAGYLLAQDKGYYKAENLDVEILGDRPGAAPAQRVANGEVEFGLDRGAGVLQLQDRGVPIVIVAQVYQDSGLLLVSKKEANVRSAQDLRGKKVGVRYDGNELAFLALLDKAGLGPGRDVQIVNRTAGLSRAELLAGELDAVGALVYDEYQVLLESQAAPQDLRVINCDDEGVGLLQDSLVTSRELLETRRDLVVRFVRASLKGWRDAIDNRDEAVTVVMRHVSPGSTSKQLQTRMLDEAARLIVPGGWSADQIGLMDAGRFTVTADIAFTLKAISRPANPAEAYTNAVVQEAMKAS